MMPTRTRSVLLLSLGLAGCGRGDAAAPATPAPSASPAVLASVLAEPPTRDLLRTAADDGSFRVLGAAFEIAGVTQAISDLGPYTVFAPTDDAFAALPPGTTEALLADDELLMLVIAYHVVPGVLTLDDLADMTSATTVLGADVVIDASSGAVKINDATVVQADLMASNGVIHAIDTLLVPEPPAAEE